MLANIYLRSTKLCQEYIYFFHNQVRPETENLG